MTGPARVALRVVLAALVPIMIGCARLAPELIAPVHGRSHAHTVASTTTELPPPHAFEAPRQREDDIDVDLYGNEVSDAIATYSLDPTGSLYEMHSPQTELPRLASPKS